MVKRHVRKHRSHSGRKKTLGKPVIGITCEVIKSRPYFSEFDLYCDYRYVRAILRARGIPILIPINPFRRDVQKLLERIHGLVIIGGADIHPSFYGEKSKEKVKPMYRGRTYFEMDLYRDALKKKIPVLAICYGMQLLNVIYGGKLYQDIQSDVQGARNHRSKRQPFHRVEVQPGSLCQKIFRKKSFLVHSQHHQAVKLPGKSLRITAVSEDGVPEAIEGPPRTMAVQWHPERQEKDPTQSRIFRHFLRLARQHQTNKSFE
ncbi:MAG TPA: gamma-glutamyl-gamma-aminobutyrate hydrolase family protein [bacterium]|nr:gamma-glutamyl-gamma-aminobutyrate hydrolase family protein [bacterium]